MSEGAGPLAVPVNPPKRQVSWAMPAVALLGLGAVAGATALARARRRSAVGEQAAGPIAPAHARKAVVTSKRILDASAALLALAVLADSGVEHYRGSFENPAMVVPLASSTATMLASVRALGGGAGGRSARDAANWTASAVGLIGLGFHFYNIDKRPGGFNWLNLFYAAPFGAPAALTLAGLIGLAAERLDPAQAGGDQTLLGLPFGRTMAGLVALGIAGTVAEVALLHFRGAFQDPFMVLPVTVPPLAAAAMAKAALAPGGDEALARGLLWVTALLGIGGVGFHAYGVSRNMGGWRNWSQNILAGPPLPAPPAFSALALAGLAALDLSAAGERR